MRCAKSVGCRAEPATTGVGFQIACGQRCPAVRMICQRRLSGRRAAFRDMYLHVEFVESFSGIFLTTPRYDALICAHLPGGGCGSQGISIGDSVSGTAFTAGFLLAGWLAAPGAREMTGEGARPFLPGFCWIYAVSARGPGVCVAWGGGQCILVLMGQTTSRS